MSAVTNIVLMTSLDSEAIVQVNIWLVTNYGLELIEVSESWQGPKVMEVEVWIGAFNYLDIDAFIATCKQQAWLKEGGAGLLIEDENGSMEYHRL